MNLYGVYVLFGMVQPIFTALGIIFVAWLLALRLGLERIAHKTIGMGVNALGNRLALLVGDDGVAVLHKCSYDPIKGGVEIEEDGKVTFYEAKVNPYSFYGSTLYTGYEGLGSMAEIPMAEVAEQAYNRYTFSERVKKKIEDLQNFIITQFGEKELPEEVKRSISYIFSQLNILRNEVEKPRITLANGGEYELADTEVPIATRKIVDLRKLIHLAPFNMEPEKWYRIEENAKLAVSRFRQMTPLVQGALILAAFVLGGIFAWFFITQGHGGGISMPSIHI